MPTTDAQMRRRAVAARGARLSPAQADLAALVAAAVAQVMEGMPWQPGCVRCVRKAKTAAEAAPHGIPAPISQSITYLPGVGPVCYGCFG